jgi:hypothetical protein
MRAGLIWREERREEERGRSARGEDRDRSGHRRNKDTKGGFREDSRQARSQMRQGTHWVVAEPGVMMGEEEDRVGVKEAWSMILCQAKVIGSDKKVEMAGTLGDSMTGKDVRRALQWEELCERYLCKFWSGEGYGDW